MSEGQPQLPISDSPPTTQVAPEPTTPAPAPPTPPVAPRSWREDLASDLRENPSIQRFENPESLARAWLNAQKFIGGEKIASPQPTWERSDWDQFYNAIGRPETAEGYDFGDFAPPEDMPWDEEFQGRMIRKMHETGLTNHQANDLLRSYMEGTAEQFREMVAVQERQRSEALNQLRHRWGQAFEPKVDLAKRAFRVAAGDDYQQIAAMRLDTGGQLGDDPRIISMFAKLGESLGEHQLVGPKETRFTMTPEEARAEQKRLLADEGFEKAYFNKQHPEHEMAVQRMYDLISSATPPPPETP
ncbi:MAG: hypothetical protein JSV86_06000 [Gemmatimonadota bacterium]|nr:MAG: hypothetical protein JSV86_06000 [Gemmatimonadota bacterium]